MQFQFAHVYRQSCVLGGYQQTVFQCDLLTHSYLACKQANLFPDVNNPNFKLKYGKIYEVKVRMLPCFHSTYYDDTTINHVARISIVSTSDYPINCGLESAPSKLKTIIKIWYIFSWFLLFFFLILYIISSSQRKRSKAPQEKSKIPINISKFQKQKPEKKVLRREHPQNVNDEKNVQFNLIT